MRKLTKNYFVRKGDAHVEALLISGDPVISRKLWRDKSCEPPSSCQKLGNHGNWLICYYNEAGGFEVFPPTVWVLDSSFGS